MDTIYHHVGPKNWMEEYRQTKNEMGGSLQKRSRRSMVQNSRGQRTVPVVLTSQYLFLSSVCGVLQNWFFFVKFDLHLFIVPLAHVRVPYIL